MNQNKRRYQPPKVELKLEITIQDKIQILSDYYKFIAKNGYDANSIIALIDYVEYLKR